jgi:hypothetical protein
MAKIGETAEGVEHDCPYGCGVAFVVEVTAKLPGVVGCWLVFGRGVPVADSGRVIRCGSLSVTFALQNPFWNSSQDQTKDSESYIHSYSSSWQIEYLLNAIRS